MTKQTTSLLNLSLGMGLILVNVLIAVIGMCMVGFAFYLYFANWGNLDPGFFIGTASIVLLFGVTLTLTAAVGCQGIGKQTKKYGI